MSTTMAKKLYLVFQLQTWYPVQAYSLHVLAASLHTRKLTLFDPSLCFFGSLRLGACDATNSG